MPPLFKDYSNRTTRRCSGRTVEGLDIEITVWSVNASTVPDSVNPVQVQSATRAAEVQGERSLFDPAVGESVLAKVVSRQSLALALR